MGDHRSIVATNVVWYIIALKSIIHATDKGKLIKRIIIKHWNQGLKCDIFFLLEIFMDGLLTFRDYCFPFRVLWKQTTGISIIATRDIQPLELVLYEWNLVVGPRKLR